jgi:hypothetical protein
MFEDLDVAANLFASADLAGSTVNEISNQFITTARLLVNDNFPTTQDGDFSDCFHECVLHILRPNLFRVLLQGIRSLTS